MKNDIIICKSIQNNKIDLRLSYGNVYFIFSLWLGIQELLFDEGEVCFIHFPTKSAIKIFSYLQRNKISKQKIEFLQSKFQVKYEPLDDCELCNNLALVMLNEMQAFDIIVLSTAGFSPDSIKHLSAFTIALLQKNPGKMIIIVQNNFIGTVYPFFEIEKITQWHIENYYTWLESKGIKTGVNPIDSMRRN